LAAVIMIATRLERIVAITAMSLESREPNHYVTQDLTRDL
jgi:hypothetical protein